MLQSLTIKNIALIDNVEINFTKGLNVLSGETGAGKSVIIESLNFVLGAKADKTLIRSGERECFVRAEFLVAGNLSVKDACEDLDISYEDVLIITRKFNLDGRTTIKINGETVTANMLKKVTSLLVDVHGQSDHYNLLKPSNQLLLIDLFGGQDLLAIKSKLQSLFVDYKSVISQLEEFGGDDSSRLLRLDVINYQINEIIKADIKENEEQELKELKLKISNQEKILSALNTIKSALSEDCGVCDVLSNINRVSGSISNINEKYQQVDCRLNSVTSELDDICSDVNILIDDFDSYEIDVDSIEERLDLINNIYRKYGGDYSSVLNFLKQIEEEKLKLENYNELTIELLNKKSKIEKLIYDEYVKLSEKRREHAKIFSGNVLFELKDLRMENASFNIAFTEIKDISECEFVSSNGFDKIEFEFSANLGEPLKPLSMVISGGEMSRFMLSIKSQTAKYDSVSTLLFDEIDTGISGVVAKVVAEKFAKISKNIQLIAISHLPQISAMADNNLLIKKVEENNKTKTMVYELNEQEKVDEVIRLIGGDKDSSAGKMHAEEMIDCAKKFKESL